MVPLRPEGRAQALERLSDADAPCLLALRHAMLYGRPALWGDDAWHPRSVLLVRPESGGGRSTEAFGLGEPEPAVPWLVARHRRSGALLAAPDAWAPWINATVGAAGVETYSVETWYDPGPPARRPGSSNAPITANRLTEHDEISFRKAAPEWALQGWGDFSGLLRYGAAFGVPYQAGFASLAWIHDQTEQFDAMSVYTLPRFRRLGLGKAVATALLDHIRRTRNKQPLWSSLATNEPSRNLVQVLGFTESSSQTVFRWPASKS